VPLFSFIKFNMATRRSKNSEEEKLDAASLEKVIKLLEPTEEGVKPITKKDACSILNITYNTTRLAKLIETYKDKKAREASRRAALRGKPATPDEIRCIIEGYLEGDPIDALSDRTFRSPGFVRQILDQYDVPIRARAHDYFKPPLIPEGAVRERFIVGEVVYSARYDSIAKVEGESLHKTGEWVYKIWLLSDKWHQYALQPASELASLEHLIKLGIKL
jgi:hypothetical protein